MKKYIRTSEEVFDTPYMIDRTYQKRDNLKADRRMVAALNPKALSYYDLHMQVHFKSSQYNWDEFIDACADEGLSVAECISRIIDKIDEHIQDNKLSTDAFVKYLRNSEQLRAKLNQFLDDNYNVIDEIEWGWFIEPEGDIVDFIDNIVNFINGRYYFTERGGDQSYWTLRSGGTLQNNDRIFLRAGRTPDNLWYLVFERELSRAYLDELKGA